MSKARFKVVGVTVEDFWYNPRRPNGHVFELTVFTDDDDVSIYDMRRSEWIPDGSVGILMVTEIEG